MSFTAQRKTKKPPDVTHREPPSITLLCDQGFLNVLTRRDQGGVWAPPCAYKHFSEVAA